MLEENDGHCVRYDFDISPFVQAPTNNLPSKTSGFVAIVKKCRDNGTNVINASKIKFNQ